MVGNENVSEIDIVSHSLNIAINQVINKCLVSTHPRRVDKLRLSVGIVNSV